jgi:hypothetical protein
MWQKKVTWSTVMELRYLEAKLPNRSPFSSMPRFRDWYINLGPMFGNVLS